MRQAARRDMQPAVSASRLNAACMEMGDGRWRYYSSTYRKLSGRGARVSSACRSDLATIN